MVVTVIVPLPPVAGAVTSVGDSVKAHVELDSVTVCDLPAIVSVADLLVEPVFAAAV